MATAKCPKCGRPLEFRHGYLHCCNCGYRPEDTLAENQRNANRFWSRTYGKNTFKSTLKRMKRGFFGG